jgi:hypothetical protein
MDWTTCKDKRFAKDVSIDKDLINSLLQSSDGKIKSSDLLPLNDTTSSSKVSLAYDSLREILEALALSNNYKIYNHECYTAFLKEIINNSLLGDEFDEIRKLRNSINYYGKKIDQESSKKYVNKIKEIIIKLQEYLEK